MGSFSLFSLFYVHILTTCQATIPAAHFLGSQTFADLPFAMRMVSARYVALQASRDVLTLPVGVGEVRSPIANSRPSPRRAWWPPQRWRELHNLTAHLAKGALGLRFGQTSWAHQEWEDIPPRTVHSVVSTMVLYWIPLFSDHSEKIKLRVYWTEL